MKNKFDTFYESMMAESTDEFDGPGMQWDGVDAESPMDATSNITEQMNRIGIKAANCISDIYALVEGEGQEMLDKQAAEKLEDIIEFASNLLRNLNNRLD